jgi:CHRD domain
MRNRTLTALSALALLAPLTMLGTPATASPADRAAVHLSARLRPSGDADGSGSASFTLDKAHRKVCATVTWRHIEDPDAAHIHRVSDGSIVVDLGGSVTEGSRCATGVPRRTIATILAHPGRFYFNVHNPTYPAGAIQGTLHR